MLSPSDIRPAVESVLRAADRSLTSYEILDRLPDDLRRQIIAERGMPGLGSGNSYSAASLVTGAVEGLLPSLKPPYRVYIHGQGVYTVAGQTIRPGNAAIAAYRLLAASQDASADNGAAKSSPDAKAKDKEGWTKQTTIAAVVAALGIAFYIVTISTTHITLQEDSVSGTGTLSSPSAIHKSSPPLKAKPDRKHTAKRNIAWQKRIAAEKTYVAAIGDLTANWGEAYQDLARLLAQLSDSPELSQTDSWRAEFVVAAVKVQYLSRQIQSLENVPDDAERHHRLWSQAAQEGDKGLTLIMRGIDKQDGDYITQGLPHFRRAVELSNAANEELENRRQRFLQGAKDH